MSTRIYEEDHISHSKAVRSPVQARSRATVDSILRGAAQVLAFKGYAGATTNHIAAAAGVSIGSLYQYFGDKDAVIFALAEQFAAETLAFSWEHLDDAPEGRPRVLAWLAALASRVAEHEALMRVLFQEVPGVWSAPGVRAAMSDALEVVRRLDPQAQLPTVEAHARALVILKSAVAVLLEIATDTWPHEHRDVVVRELAAMLGNYLYP